MRRVLLKIAPILHLTRVTTAFAAVGNIWFVVLWTMAMRQDEPGAEAAATPLSARLIGGAIVGVSLFAFGAALNDTLDLRRDRVLNPLRPLPSGRLNFDTAVGMVVLTLLAATLGATTMGTSAVLMCLLTAGAVFFYNAAARFVPSVGIVALSLIYAAHMLIPNVGLVFVWPVWLVMTHAMLVGAVTHRLGQRRPALSPASIVAATLGWAFWSAALLYLGVERSGGLWPSFVKPWAAIGPGLLAAGFVVLAWRKVERATSGPRAAEKISRYGALWLTLYGAAWLFGQGEWRYGLALSALAAAGFLGMTVLREMYALLERPLAYRR